jgi:hypothetical protein
MHGNKVNLEIEHWHEHVSILVETRLACKIIILCNPKLHNNRTILNNKPDTIIRNNEEETCVLIDVAISGQRKVIKKEAEKIQK